MARIDPSDQPSIFPTSDSDEDATGRMWRPPPPIDSPPPVRRPTSPHLPPPSADFERLGPSRRLLVAVGAAGLLILLVGGFVAGSLLRPDGAARVDASPSLSATASTSVPPLPSASATPSSTSAPTTTPTASPTPAPAPAGPPQQLAIGGWATVTTGELNVRSGAGVKAATSYQLVNGAVAHVFEGPVAADGFDWYRIGSLGGARGWAASGPANDPFLTTLAESRDLVRCGTVQGDVLAVVDGRVGARDPVHVGDLALPAAAFDDEELGALELMRATGGEACFSATVGADEAPLVYATFNYYACGRAVEAGDLIELHPSTGMDVVVESQVKDVTVIHPAILERSGAETASNLEGVLRWMARAGGWGCFSHGVNEGPDGTRGGVELDARGCGIVEYGADGIVLLRPASGGDSVPLTGTAIDPGVPIGVRSGMMAWAFDFPGQPYATSLTPYAMPDCG